MSSFRYLCPNHAVEGDYKLACHECSEPAYYVSKRDGIEAPTDGEDVAAAAHTLRSLGLKASALYLEDRWRELKEEG